MRNYLTTLLFTIFALVSFTACQPDRGTKDEKEAVKGDTLNVREGEGEGPIGEGDKGV